MTDAAVRYDPYAADLRADPYPTYAWLREEAPVYHHPDKGFFALSRFGDVLGDAPRLVDLLVRRRASRSKDCRRTSSPR